MDVFFNPNTNQLTELVLETTISPGWYVYRGADQEPWLNELVEIVEVQGGIGQTSDGRSIQKCYLWVPRPLSVEEQGKYFDYMKKTVEKVENVPRYICGYRGSGKDAFFKFINLSFATADASVTGSIEYKYEIYSRLSPELTRSIVTRPGIRKAFADRVKELIAEKHGISLSELESNKPKYRQELIDLGQGMKDVDPLFWVNQVDITNDTIITDFRFKIEYGFGHTIRVFRSCVEKPTDPSEIDLDDFETDIIVFPPGEYEAMIKVFPQYKNHRCIDYIFC